jgi:hypothetical protein
VTYPTTKFVSVKTCVSGNLDIPAESNYWGSGSPDPSKFAACVDYQPYLTSPPTRSFGVSRVDVTPAVFELRAEPNPFGDGVLLVFPVLEEGKAEARLQVFDVTGRLVRTVASGIPDPGDYRFAWDSRDEYGERVPAGIYFVRLRVAGRVRTVKLIGCPDERWKRSVPLRIYPRMWMWTLKEIFAIVSATAAMGLLASTAVGRILEIPCAVSSSGDGLAVISVQGLETDGTGVVLQENEEIVFAEFSFQDQLPGGPRSRRGHRWRERRHRGSFRRSRSPSAGTSGSRTSARGRWSDST